MREKLDLVVKFTTSTSYQVGGMVGFLDRERHVALGSNFRDFQAQRCDSLIHIHCSDTFNRIFGLRLGCLGKHANSNRVALCCYR